MYTYEEEKIFQNAIVFASGAMSSCHNRKPVLLHSLRVAFLLYKMNYAIDLVIAAVLHDLIEDTRIIIANIQAEFGEHVGHLVDLLTMNENIENYTEQYIANFQKAGLSKEALIIRCADILDNMQYIKRLPPEKQELVKNKHIYFYQNFQETLKNEPIWVKFKAVIYDC